MKSLEEHRNKLREITDLAFAYGVDSLTEEQNRRLPFKLTEEEKRFFFQKCHEGFKLAQKQLIAEIIDYQNHLSEAKLKLKESRRQRDKKSESEINDMIGAIEQRLRTFSHVADGIAWQLIGGEIHIARRFYIGERDLKQLTASNLKHAISVADEINKKPDDFALLSDLTGFVQIGDLLVRHKTSFGIMELKEGKVNEQISSFLNQLEKQGESINDEKLKEVFDKDTIKQVKRMQRQMERMTRAAEVLKKDKGINPGTGEPIRVYTPKVGTERYHKELSELHEELQKKAYGYTVVDGCLLIGMYSEETISKGGPMLIELILKEKATNYVIIDWMSITHNISEPIFGKPLKPDFIINVLTGKVKVILGLDFDTLIELFNHEGLPTRWLSEKETNGLKNSSLVINKRAIEITLPNGDKNILGGGIASKILYDSIKPSNIAQQFLHLNNEDFDDKEPDHNSK